MIHSEKKKKGMLVPHDTAVQIMLHKHSTYEHMLQRCQKAVYPTDDDAAYYYIANSTGACIASGDAITMDMSDGTVKTVPWTLEMYLKCSKKKYPSRARFYCVQRVCGKWFTVVGFIEYYAIIDEEMEDRTGVDKPQEANLDDAETPSQPADDAGPLGTQPVTLDDPGPPSSQSVILDGVVYPSIALDDDGPSSTQCVLLDDDVLSSTQPKTLDNVETPMNNVGHELANKPLGGYT